MSWKMEVFTDNEWASNALRYATEQEAINAGRELLSRWWVPTDSRAVETPDEPVNYRFDAETWKNIRIVEPEPIVIEEEEPLTDVDTCVIIIVQGE
jgi:hypothetical protein